MSSLVSEFYYFLKLLLFTMPQNLFFFPSPKLWLCCLNHSSKSNVFLLFGQWCYIWNVSDVYIMKAKWERKRGKMCVYICHYNNLQNALLWKSKPYSNAGCVVFFDFFQDLILYVFYCTNRDSQKKSKVALCVCINYFFFHLNKLSLQIRSTQYIVLDHWEARHCLFDIWEKEKKNTRKRFIKATSWVCVA